MRKLLASFLFISFFAASAFASVPKIDVCFSPNGGCTAAIVREIQAAKTSIDAEAYTFTSVPIADALVRAKQRGVRVRVLLDRSNATKHYSAFGLFQMAKIPVVIDHTHAIMHNKVFIIDHRIVMTGSFNFSKAAETKNAENLLRIIRNGEDVTEQFLARSVLE